MDGISSRGGQFYPMDDRLHSGGRERHQEPPEQEHSYAWMQQVDDPERRRSPHFGHEEQCYSFDNRCHCSSTRPYQLPPEGYGTSLLPPEPPLDVRMTPRQIQTFYSSHARGMQHHSTLHMHPLTNPPITSQKVNYINSNSHSHPLRGESGKWTSGTHVHMPAVTNPFGMQQWSDLPPPYDSLPNIPPVKRQPPPPYSKHQ